MRTKSLEVRRMQHQINQLEKQLNMKRHLDILEEGLTSGKKMNVEEMFMMMIMQKFLGGNPQQQVQMQPPLQQQKVNLTDEQIKGVLDEYKGYLSIAKDFSDEEVRRLIRTQMPQLSDDTIERGIKIMREQNG
jgi:hypothetical protein